MKTSTLVPVTLTLLLVLPVVVLAQTGRPALENPIACPDLFCLFRNIIRYFLGLLALFATAVFVYGGFLLLTSGGQPERIKKGKETLFWATMGIITVVGSWVFIKTVLEALSARH